MKQDTLIISNHHKRSVFFEESMRRLADHGYTNICIQDTGNESWGAYQGPKSMYFRSGNIPYDTGMVNFKTRILPMISRPWSRILMIDNDCFIADPTVVDRYIEDFENGKYDFSCHHVSANDYDKYVFGDSTIAPVENQTFEPADIYPGFCPVPHWENAYLLINRPTWDSCSGDDISHGRKWIKAMATNGAKFGAHAANYRLIYSHYGEGWFHVGNLFAYYYRLENGQEFNPKSTLDMSRLGYFYAQEWFDAKINPIKHGEKSSSYSIYPRTSFRNLEKNSNLYETAMLAWSDLIKDTCMENF